MAEDISSQLVGPLRKWPVICGVVIVVTLLTFHIMYYPPFGEPPVNKQCSSNNPDFATHLKVIEETNTSVTANDSTIYRTDQYWKLNDSVYGCPCSLVGRPCIRKCCGINEVFNKKGRCISSIFPNTLDTFLDSVLVYNKTPFLNFLNEVKEPRIKFSVLPNCPSHHYVRRKLMNQRVFVFEDGRAWEKYYNKFIDQSNYCLDLVLKNGSETGNVPLGYAICRAKSEEMQWKTKIYHKRWLFRKCIQMVSLLIYLVTFIVFALQPDIRRGYGRWLMCFLAARFIRIIDVLTMFDVHLNFPHTCIFIVTVLQYSELASQAWQVVIYWHIWRALRPDYFSNLGPVCTYNNKRFMFFSTVAWGTPAVIIAIVTSMVQLMNKIYQVRYVHCWNNNRAARHIYLTIPHLITDLTNLVLCLDILRRLRTYKKDSATLPPNNIRQYNATEIQWSCKYVKISIGTSTYLLLMSILMMVDRVIHVKDFIYYTAEALDTLRGIEIFFIFVCHKAQFLQLRDKVQDCWRYFHQRRTRGLFFWYSVQLRDVNS